VAVVAPAVDVGREPEVAPVLGDLGDDQGLEAFAPQGVQGQGSGVADAEQPGGKADVDEVERWGLDQAFTEVGLVWRQEVDQIARPENAEPSERDAGLAPRVG
jgi:hypothetical protein